MQDQDMSKRLRILAIVSALVVAYLAADIMLWMRVDQIAPRENLVREAIARRENTADATVDVSDIANKYISAGQTRAAATKYLESLGFEIRHQLIEFDGAEALIATRSPLKRTLGNYSLFPTGEGLEVIVYLNAQIVRNAVGQIYYDSLVPQFNGMLRRKTEPQVQS
jgi:hypothetical protein